jgi:hypothetical protein
MQLPEHMAKTGVRVLHHRGKRYPIHEKMSGHVLVYPGPVMRAQDLNDPIKRIIIN